jgi:hypothetical protein
VAEYLDPVVVELEGRDQKLLDTLTRAKAEVRKFTDEVGRMNATVHVKVDLADGEIRKIQERIGKIKATIRVGLRLDQTDRDRITADLDGKQFNASIHPALDDNSRRLVEAALDHLTRARTVSIVADVDTQAAAADLDLLTRARQVRIVADADTRAAADDLALLTRPRTVTIHTNTTGGNTPNTPNNNRSARSGKPDLSLKSLLTLAPALVPIAAQATVVAAQMGAAAIAVGTFGLAVKSQLSSLGDAADAQGKVTDAVAKYGPASKQAAQAQLALSQTLSAVPAQTRQAAGAFLNLKSDFKSWSDGLAKFTMVPVTQGIGVLDALLPKLSPLVKDTSAQFTRLTTLLAGGVNSGAFDGLMKRFTAFTNGVLKSAVDGVVHFTRVLSQGGGSGAFGEFMTYAKANAPLVKETLKNLAEAVLNILRAASQAGPGMLTLVNTFAKLVAALPPSVIAALMQVAAAIKLIKLAGTGLSTVAGGIQSLGTRLTALRAASAGAGGGLAGLRAAFLSLGTAAKATVIVAAIAAVVVGVSKLASLGQKAPPDIDKLTNSLGRLGTTGQVNGEALDAFGKNLAGLRDSVKSFVAPSVLDNIQQGIIKVVTLGNVDSTPVKEAKDNLNAIDKALANLVQGGHADLASAALEKLKAAYAKGGHNVGNFTKNLTEYKKAVDDAKFAQELTAQSQGLFGSQAQKTAAQLDKQKASADGLRQALQALNDVNRAGLGGMIGFEAAIDAASSGAKKYHDVLSMNNGQLSLGTDKQRQAAQILSDLADKTDAAASSQREAGASWQTVNGIYDRGRKKLIDVAQAMGLSASEAKALASQILKIPNKTAKFKMDTADARAGLEAFNAAVKRTPGSKSVTLKTLSTGAEQILESFGLKVKRLPNGQVKVTTKNGQALSAIANVAAALRNLNGKTATTWTYHNVKTTYSTAGSVSGGKSVHGMVGATGGLLSKLPIKRLATGGEAQIAPNGFLRGPGNGTSDSILALFASGALGRVSNTEFVVNAKETAKHRRLLELINSGLLPKFAKGGLTQAAKEARGQLAGGFGISSFGRMAGYQRTPFEHELAASSDINALVSSLNQFRGEIKKAFSGRTESSLLRQLDKAGKSLISYDKQLSKVTSSLASAKSKLDDLKNSAAQLKSSVAASIMQGASVVTQAPQEGFALRSVDVVNNMNAQLQKASAFSAQLQQLKKRGLSADLLQQIAEAGVDQGGATAEALAGASNAQIKQLNQMQSQLKKSANAAGSAVSDSMYGAGIKAAEGLVKGLEKKQKAIEAAMLRIAKSMEKAIKAALKIKSPSQVMADLGDYTALGLAHGIQRSSKHAAIAARGLAMSVQQGATLTGSPTWAGVPMGGGSGGGQVVLHQHVHINVEGHVMTERKLIDVVEKGFLQRGARNPLTYTQYKR